jgi:hypothetical protein
MLRQVLCAVVGWEFGIDGHVVECEVTWGVQGSSVQTSSESCLTCRYRS